MTWTTYDNTPRLIIARWVEALRVSLLLSEAQCYPSAQAAYIEGQDWRVLQVVAGSITPYGEGVGAQEGGALMQQLRIETVLWQRLKLDLHGMSEIALTEASDGILDYTDLVRALFAFTDLGGLIEGIPFYAGETPTVWFDAESGVLQRTLMHDVVFAMELPRTQTVNLPTWINPESSSSSSS